MSLVPNAINLGEPWSGSQDTPAAPLWQLLEMGGFAVRIGYVAGGFLQANEHLRIRTPPRVSTTPITLRFYVGEYLNNAVRSADTRLTEIGTATFTQAEETILMPSWRAGHNRTVQLFMTVDNPRDLRWAPEGGYVVELLQTEPLSQAQTVTPAGAAPTVDFGTARLGAGAVTLVPTGIAPTSEVGPPVASSGGTVISASSITSAVMVGSPAVTGRRPVPKTISPLGIAPRFEIGRLKLTQGRAGPRTLGVQGIDSANTFGSAVAYGLAPYSPYVVTSSIPSRTSFGNYASIRLASQPQPLPGADPLERVIMANIASVRTAQEVLTVEIPIDLTKDTYTDPTTGVQKPLAEGTPITGVPLVKLPRGARILGGGVVTTTAITDSAAKVSLKLFEPKTNTAIYNGDDIKSAGNRPIAGAGVFFEDTPVQFALTATKITAGQIIVSLQFAVRDRADYNLGGV